VALKLVHIASMAMWFGSGLGVAADIRRTAALGPPHLGPLAGRVARMLRLMWIAGLLTVGTGVAIVIVNGGGFKLAPPRIHAALGITIVMLIIMAIGLGPTSRKIALAETDAPKVRLLGKRFAMFMGFVHLGWLAALVTMIDVIFK
jgi:hypothetical protein